MGTFLGDALIIRAGIFCGCGTLGMLQWDSSLLTCPECDNVFIWSDGRLQNGRLQNGKAFLPWLYSCYTWGPGCVHVCCEHLCTEHLWAVPVVVLLLCCLASVLVV